MEQKNVKIAKILTISVATVMFLLCVVLVFQFVKISNLKQHQKELSSRLTELEKSILHYDSENSYLESSDFIEDYAREVLGYGKAGEVRFK